MYALGTAYLQFEQHTKTFFEGCISSIKSAQNAASRLLFCKTPDQKGYSELTDSGVVTSKIKFTNDAECLISKDALNCEDPATLFVPHPENVCSKSYFKIENNNTIVVKNAITEDSLEKMKKHGCVKCPLSRQDIFQWISLKELSEMDLREHNLDMIENQTENSLNATSNQVSSSSMTFTEDVNHATNDLVTETNSSTTFTEDEINATDDLLTKTYSLLGAVGNHFTPDPETLENLSIAVDSKTTLAQRANAIIQLGLVALEENSSSIQSGIYAGQCSIYLSEGDLNGATESLGNLAGCIFNSRNCINDVQKGVKDLVGFFNGAS